MAKRRRRRAVPRRVSRYRRLIALVKRNPIKSATTVLAFLAVIPTGMAGLNYIDNRVEPWYLAWHWWTRDLVKTVEDKIDTQDHKTSSILRDIQVDTANSKLASTVNDIKKWQLELKKATDQNSVDLITQQIEALEDTKSKLDTQLKVLNKIKTNP